MSTEETWKEALARIAVEELQIDVFEHQCNDDGDEHSVTIHGLRRALQAAYRAGVAGGLRHVRIDNSASHGRE